MDAAAWRARIAAARASAGEGDVARALSDLDALAAEVAGDPEAVAAADLGRIDVLAAAGRPEAEVEAARLAEEPPVGARRRVVVGALRHLAAARRSSGGTEQEVLAPARRAVEIMRAGGDPAFEADALANLATLLHLFGDMAGMAAVVARIDALGVPRPVQLEATLALAANDSEGMERLLEQSGAPILVRTLLGRTRLMRGEPLLALAAVDGTRSPEAAMVRAEALRMLGRNDEARVAYLDIERRVPPGRLLGAYCALNRGLLLVSEGQVAAGEELLAPLAVKFADHPVARLVTVLGRLQGALRAGEWARVRELGSEASGLAAAVRNPERDVAVGARAAAVAAEACGAAGVESAVLLRALALERWSWLGAAAEADQERGAIDRLVRAGAPVPVGRTLLREVLGAGYSASVHEATLAWTGERVAVKVLGGARRAAVESEVRAIARLRHPHVLGLLDAGPAGPAAAVVGIDPATPVLVTELATAGTLAARVGLLEWREVRAVLQALLAALGHAHACGVVHLDVKPANVLLTGDPTSPVVRLADFGVARMLHDAGRDRVGGTPVYMAPEQVRGHIHEFGPWTDLYALGCVATELVTGHPPFPLDTFEALALAHPYRAPPALRPTVAVPEGLEGWILRLLAKAPADRFRRAADAARALAGLGPASVRPVVAAEAPPSSPLSAATVVLGTGTIDDLLDADDDDRPRCPIPPPAVPERRPVEPAVEPIPGHAGTGLVRQRRAAFVGRHVGRDALWEALAATALGGTARAAVVTGEPGIGTTALAEWLCERAHESGAATPIAAEGPEPPEGFDARVAREAVERTVIVRVERAHERPAWMAWVDRLLGARRPVLAVLTAARGTRLLVHHPLTVRVPVPPMEVPELAALARSVLPLSPALATDVALASGGRPGRLLDTLAWLVEEERLLQAPEGWVLRPGAERLVAPDGERRLGRDLLAGLPPAAFTGVLLGALLGPEVDRAQWERACEALGSAPSLGGWDRLVAAQIASASDVGWTFEDPDALAALRAEAERSDASAVLRAACETSTARDPT